MTTSKRLGVAVVGAGYWGPNLVRNFRASRGLGPASRSATWTPTGPAGSSGARSGVDVDRRRSTDLLARDDIDAVAIATPARTHQPIALAALRGRQARAGREAAGRQRREPAARWSSRAPSAGLVLMADHTYCYTPAVQQIRELVADGRARRHPVRRLGPDQPRPGPARRRRLLGPRAARPVDPRLRPARRAAARRRVGAHGADPLGAGKACVGYLTLPLPAARIAHVHVNWLSPTKIRQMVIGGSKRTLVWDDLNPQQRLSVYDRGVDLASSPSTRADRARRHGLLPPRRHLGAGPARARGARRDGRRVRRQHPRGPRAAHRRRGRAAGALGPRGGRARASRAGGALVDVVVRRRTELELVR